jgi:hypothetical protein
VWLQDGNSGKGGRKDESGLEGEGNRYGRVGEKMPRANWGEEAEEIGFGLLGTDLDA